MIEVISKSPNETEEYAEKLGKRLNGGEVIAFFGGLGMGKTRFTSGLAKGMGIDEYVSSPTFAIVNEYEGDIPLCHFDMYRITSFDDLCSTGFFDYLDNGSVLAIEWSENIENALPENTVYVEIENSGENSRKIKIYNKE